MRSKRDKGHMHVGCAFCDHQSCMADIHDGCALALQHMITKHWDVLEAVHASVISDSANSEFRLMHYIDSRIADKAGG